MKWWESLAIIASISAIIQFIKWVIDVLTGESLGNILTFLLSTIFVSLIILVLFLNQIYKDHIKIKEFLKEKGFKEN